MHCRSPPGTPFHVAVAPASSSPTDSQPCREDKHLIDVHTSHIQTPHNKPPLSWKGTRVYFSETLVLVVAPCPEEPALQLSSWPFAFAASNPSIPSGWWWLPHGDQFLVALATELASLSPPASWAGTRERKGEGRGRGWGGALRCLCFLDMVLPLSNTGMPHSEAIHTICTYTQVWGVWVGVGVSGCT